MALKDIAIKLTATGAEQVAREFRSTQSATQQMASSLERVQRQMAGLVGGFSMALVVRECLAAALAVERIEAAMKATYGSGQAAARELQYVRDEARRLGLVYNDTALAYAKFSASTRNTSIEGEATRRIFTGVSEAVTALKLSGDEANGIFLALSQMMSKGKISAEELSGQLGERLPGAVKLTADAMGLTTQELLKQMQEGKLMSSDVLPKLAEQLHKTYGAAATEAATKGQAGINRFNNELKETASLIGSKMLPAISAMGGSMAEALKDFREQESGGLRNLRYLVSLAANPNDSSTVKSYTEEYNRRHLPGANADPQALRLEADARARQEVINAERKATEAAALARAAAEKEAEKAAKAADQQYQQYGHTLAGFNKQIRDANPFLTEHEKALESVDAAVRQAVEHLPQYSQSLTAAGAAIKSNIELAKQMKDAIASTSQEFQQYLAAVEAEPAQHNGAGAMNLRWEEELKMLDALQPSAEMDKLSEQLAVFERLLSDMPEKAGAVAAAVAKLKADFAASSGLTSLLAENAQRAASMAGVNPDTGAVDSISGALANQLAVQEEAHKREIELINAQKESTLDAYAASTQSAEAYAQTIAKLAALENARALAEQEHTLKTKAVTTRAYTAQLAMAGQYTGLAGDLFAGLAATQDQSTRKGFETAKAFNLGAAIMSTAQATIAQLTGPDAWTPIAWTRAGVAAALGAMQIAKIASTTYGGGGSVSAAVPSGSFGGSGSATAGSSIGAPVQSLAEIQTEASLRKLAQAAESASLAVAKVADGITKVSQLFETGYSKNVASGLGTAGPQDGNSGLGRSAAAGAALGAGVGSFATPIGAVVGGLIGSALGSLGNMMFGWGNGWYTKDSGLSLSMQGGNFAGQSYHTQKKDGGWFTGDKTRTQYGALNSQVQESLTGYLSQIKATISNAAVALGTGTDFARAGTVAANISTAGKTPEEIQKELEAFYANAANALAKTTKGLEEFAFYGENAFDALIRLSTSLQGVNGMLELTGHTLVASTLAGANAAWKLADAFGGLDKMQEAVDAYFKAMFTDTEQEAMRAAQEARQVQAAFAQMHLAVPATREGFIALVNSIDVTTASGATLYQALMAIAPAFAGAAVRAEELRKAQEALNEDLAVRLLKVSGYDNEATLLSLRIRQEEELNAAREKGLSVTRLLAVQQREYAAEVRAIQQAAHDKVIAAEKALLNERLSAAQKTASSWRSATESLTAAIESLSGATPAGSLSSARSGYATALASARHGNVDDANRLGGLATSYLEALRASGATGLALATAAATLRAELSGVRSLTGSRASFAERQVAILEAQLKALNGGADDAAATLRAAQAEYAATLRLATTASATLAHQASAAATAHADALAIVAAVRGSRPSFAVGSSFIGADMTADIHYGEKVIDAQSSAILNRYGIRVQGGSGDSAELAALLKAVLGELSGVKAELASLKAEQKAGLIAVAKNTGDATRVLKRWDADAVPTREVA